MSSTTAQFVPSPLDSAYITSKLRGIQGMMPREFGDKLKIAILTFVQNAVAEYVFGPYKELHGLTSTEVLERLKQFPGYEALILKRCIDVSNRDNHSKARQQANNDRNLETTPKQDEKACGHNRGFNGLQNLLTECQKEDVTKDLIPLPSGSGRYFTDSLQDRQETARHESHRSAPLNGSFGGTGWNPWAHTLVTTSNSLPTFQLGGVTRGTAGGSSPNAPFGYHLGTPQTVVDKETTINSDVRTIAGTASFANPTGTSTPGTHELVSRGVIPDDGRMILGRWVNPLEYCSSANETLDLESVVATLRQSHRG
ncbi:hypothetical protein QFC24_000652 [Naganishia onofrii]|uniref:Uncharacterized protein n=1 Tax=Naganishia onofrii TaxID=1851511 RepID=A0ACC2XXI1_9TREE|nr:hypothetical protein QFC24_000652 [Naganishia onofrii]